MGEAVAEARRQVELTREELEQDVVRFEARVRAELDWKSRLRRQGPQLAIILGAVALVAVSAVALRHAVRAEERDPDPVPLEDLNRVTLRDVALEIRALRRDLNRDRDKGKDGMGRKLALAALGAAAQLGGRMAARRVAETAEPAGGKRR